MASVNPNCDTQVPANKNFLSPLNFVFQIKKAPHVSYFVQQVNVPSLSLASPITTNPMLNIPFPGEHLQFGQLDVTFKVDEDFKNYLEIHNWLTGLGKPETFSQYDELEENQKQPLNGDGIYSDMSLIIMSNARQPNFEISFIDGYPTGISDISFNSLESDVNYVNATASFKYTMYKIADIS